MSSIWTIALNTFREAVRDKIFYTLLGFAFVMTGFSVLLSTMTLSTYVRVIMDVGMANIEVFGTLIAIFVGINLVHKEIDRRTIYTIITRPVERHHFILGKYLGLVGTLAVQVAIMSALFLFVVWLFPFGTEYLGALIPAIWLIFIQLMFITAVAVLFSAYSTPILAGMFTLGFYLVGTSSWYLRTFLDENSSDFMRFSVKFLSYTLPDFTFLNLKGEVVNKIAFSGEYVVTATAYGLSYSLLALIIAILIFRKKDIK